MSRTKVIGDGVALATDASALGLPPSACAFVDHWNSDICGSPREFLLEIWANGDRELSDAALYGGQLHPLAFADTTVTANASTNALTAAGHGRYTGDGPVLLTGDDVPLPTDTSTRYWLIKVDDNTLKLALSLEEALADEFVDLADAGSGTIKIVDVDGETSRVHWHSHGLLGLDGDGAIALTDQDAYTARLPHNPRAVAYAVVATLDEDTGEVSARVYALQDV